MVISGGRKNSNGTFEMVHHQVIVLSCSVVSVMTVATSLLCPGDFPGTNTGVHRKGLKLSSLAHSWRRSASVPSSSIME